MPVAPTYGLTEACSQVTTNGVPLFCTRVELADDGEILVTGPTVAGGGDARTPATSGAFDDRGRLHITGRKADTIVTGGENVAPAEVEAVLEAHPAVAEAAVLGRPDPEWGEAVVALVVPRDGATLDPDDAAPPRAERAGALQGPQGHPAPDRAAATHSVRKAPPKSLLRTGSDPLTPEESQGV